jgi:4-hydroxyphenylacetate 3-monooxygenase
VRLQVLKGAERGGRLKEMEALVDRCMADYDENGWTGDTWLPPLDAPGSVRNAAE